MAAQPSGVSTTDTPDTQDWWINAKILTEIDSMNVVGTLFNSVFEYI